MPQLHFSVDERTAKRIEREAKRRGVSISKLLASIVTRDIAHTWPASYLESVVGGCRESPLSVPEDLPLDDVHLGAD